MHRSHMHRSAPLAALSALTTLTSLAVLAAFTPAAAAAQTLGPFEFLAGAGNDFYTLDRPIQSNSCTPNLCFGQQTSFVFLPPGTGRVLTFNTVQGQIRLSSAWPLTPPDGVPTLASCGPGNATDLLPRNGHSGIIHTTRAGFLAGMFLTPATPAVGSQPPTLTFTGDAFTTLAPLMQQVFFIGDGRSSTNAPQQFLVPDGANRLVMGVADGCCVRGNSGSYCDNSGLFQGTFTVSGCLLVTQQPVGRQVCTIPGSTSLSVAVTGSGTPSFQWRRNGVPIPTTGPGANPSAATSTLQLTGLTQSDTAGFDCVITAPCGTFTTLRAQVTVQPACCDGVDFNNDDVFPDDQDLVDFVNILAGGQPCIDCNDIDFNNDGVFPDDQDVTAFLRVLAGGTCW